MTEAVARLLNFRSIPVNPIGGTFALLFALNFLHSCLATFPFVELSQIFPLKIRSSLIRLGKCFQAILKRNSETSIKELTKPSRSCWLAHWRFNWSEEEKEYQWNTIWRCVMKFDLTFIFAIKLGSVQALLMSLAEPPFTCKFDGYFVSRARSNFYC